ncbi:MAG TPA: AAA family ATPase [Candidatus Paceibacterota bacterium]|nr:AAA family ATPase [Candidatus Paceibacterota bacterium]
MTQAQALTILKTGASVFLTGEPGAGKTHTINEYVRYLREHDIEPAITASTGIAATHIHGQTIHSWSGIGVRRNLSSYDLDTITTTEYLARRIQKTKVLIIDEISMIDAQTLDMVEAVCRAIKQLQEPFGGIQVILVGDFFQLPPVGNQSQFAFESKAWQVLCPLVCYITEQHRQSDDRFLSILSAIRKNEYGEAHHEYLQERFVANQDSPSGGETLTRLFSHNADVDTLNTKELEKIKSPARTFTMKSKGKDSLVASLKKGCLSPEKLDLKIGATVMCTKNSREKGFVNGTLGTVIDFEPATTYPIITTRHGDTITMEPMDWNIEENGSIKASITQVPLRLAWAITIHKSQGMSLDAAVMDLREVFEYGQGYVALSRVRSLSGLYLLGTNPRVFQVHPSILAIDDRFRTESEHADVLFGDMAKTAITDMHRNFITAVGGNLTPSKKKVLKQKDTRDTAEITRELVAKGKPLIIIASERSLSPTTILGHIEKLVEAGKLTFKDIEHLFDKTLLRTLPEFEATFKKLDTTLLSPVFNHYNGKHSFDKLRLARLAFLARKVMLE